MPNWPYPSIEELQATAETFGAMQRPDRSLAAFRQRVGDSVDPLEPNHAQALLDWLNAWGCRMDSSDSGCRIFAESLATWWIGNEPHLPDSQLRLVDCTGDTIERAAIAFEALSASRASERRTVASTAAAKTLHALRPLNLIAWDRAIALCMHNSRGREAYAEHLRWGQTAASRLIEEAKERGWSGEVELVANLGRTGFTLAKVLDEHLYVTISRAA